MRSFKSANTITNLSSIPVHARCFLMLRQTKSMSTEQWLPLKFAVHFQGLTFAVVPAFPTFTGIKMDKIDPTKINEYKFDAIHFWQRLHAFEAKPCRKCLLISCDGTVKPSEAQTQLEFFEFAP